MKPENEHEHEPVEVDGYEVEHLTAECIEIGTGEPGGCEPGDVL